MLECSWTNDMCQIVLIGPMAVGFSVGPYPELSSQATDTHSLLRKICGYILHSNEAYIITSLSKFMIVKWESHSSRKKHANFASFLLGIDCSKSNDLFIRVILSF